MDHLDYISIEQERDGDEGGAGWWKSTTKERKDHKWLFISKGTQKRERKRDGTKVVKLLMKEQRNSIDQRALTRVKGSPIKRELKAIVSAE